MDMLFEKLSRLSGSCFIGNITETADVIIEQISPYVDEISRDKTGGVIAKINGKSDYTLFYQAHMDEIGMIVTKVLGDGFFKAAAVGGIDIRVLPSTKVTIHGKHDIPGIFTSTPPHLAKSTDSNKFPSFDEIMIDTGLKNADELIETGDFITYNAPLAKMSDDYVTGKSLDNRTGCLALIESARLIFENGKPENTVIYSFSTGEELGNRGAAVAAYSIDADEAIAVDVSFGLSPNAPSEHCGTLGDGTMIGISPVLSRDVFDKLTDSAESENIKYQLEVMGGRTSTDADVIAISKSGVKCGLLSIPLRYMHTPIEVVKLSDIENVAMILAAYSKNGDKLC